MLKLLVGKTIQKITEDSDSIVFVCTDGDAFEAYHMQDCCERVTIYDVIGDLQSLVGQTITVAAAEESGFWPEDVPEHHTESFTWTFHTFIAGDVRVVVRWLGESNGYYSESVHFGRMHHLRD